MKLLEQKLYNKNDKIKEININNNLNDYNISLKKSNSYIKLSY